MPPIAGPAVWTAAGLLGSVLALVAIRQTLRRWRLSRPYPRRRLIARSYLRRAVLWLVELLAVVATGVLAIFALLSGLSVLRTAELNVVYTVVLVLIIVLIDLNIWLDLRVWSKVERPPPSLPEDNVGVSTNRRKEDR
jgi:cytochrome c biogenesis protein ResB